MKHVSPLITFGIIHRLHYNTITLVLVFESRLPGGLIGPLPYQEFPLLRARYRDAHKDLVKRRVYSRLGRKCWDVVCHDGGSLRHANWCVIIRFEERTIASAELHRLSFLK